MNFPGALTDWYEEHQRELPWRRTKDPYRIWVSEVILQQTRVGQGLEYYNRFVAAFPDAATLASAPEEKVLKLWQGLGYYSRARNMIAAARQIMENHQAVFPRDLKSIRALKGVGDYTAAAIASIAFNDPYPVVDGNVFRVLSRFKGIHHPIGSATGKKEAAGIAGKLMDRTRPGTFNQAMMELGAMVCTPRQPRCHECPLKNDCYAFKKGMTGDLPLKRTSPRVKKRYLHYFIIISGKPGQELVFIRKRGGGDIWENLYDFPLIEKERLLNFEAIQKTDEWMELAGDVHFDILQESDPVRHMLSHRELIVRFFLLRSAVKQIRESIQVKWTDIGNYPVPRLIERYMNEAFSWSQAAAEEGKNIPFSTGILARYHD